MESQMNIKIEVDVAEDQAFQEPESNSVFFIRPGTAVNVDTYIKCEPEVSNDHVDGNHGNGKHGDGNHGDEMEQDGIQHSEGEYDLDMEKEPVYMVEPFIRVDLHKPELITNSETGMRWDGGIEEKQNIGSGTEFAIKLEPGLDMEVGAAAHQPDAHTDPRLGDGDPSISGRQNTCNTVNQSLVLCPSINRYANVKLELGQNVYTDTDDESETDVKLATDTELGFKQHTGTFFSMGQGTEVLGAGCGLDTNSGNTAVKNELGKIRDTVNFERDVGSDTSPHAELEVHIKIEPDADMPHTETNGGRFGQTSQAETDAIDSSLPVRFQVDTGTGFSGLQMHHPSIINHGLQVISRPDTSDDRPPVKFQTCSSDCTPHSAFQADMSEVWNNEQQPGTPSYVSDKQFVCTVCNRGFTSFDGLEQHVRKHTGDEANCGEKNFTCDQCSAAFIKSSSLKKHMRKHTSETPFFCKLCGVYFTQFSDLAEHTQVHQGEKAFTCNRCRNSFSDFKSFRKHLKAHQGERPLKCEHCNASFSHPSNLKLHLQIHEGNRPFGCNQCNASFSNSSSLKKHMRIHTCERPFVCKQCFTAFMHPNGLKLHLRLHTGEKPYVCNQCNASFSQAGSLKQHMFVHTGDRPFACTECSSTFNHSSSLVKHMRTHTGERPFVCSQCKAAFSQSSGLKKHLQLHAGEKPYVCGQCNACFTQSAGLKKHMRTHAGNTPFSCNECAALFNAFRHLIRHKRTQHAKQSEQP